MRAVAMLLAVLMLAACGQKGPLYLRDKPPPGVKPPKSEAYRAAPYPAESEEDAEKKK